MNKALLAAVLAAATLFPIGASADEGHGRVVVVPRYWGWHGAHVAPWGPSWGNYWGPYWGPGWGVPYAPAPALTTGQVKLDTKVKDAEVYVNGGYLGTTGDNKTIALRPGKYKIEIKEPGHPTFTANVYVSVGKTVRLKPEL